MKKTTNEIRQDFLNFFKEKGHVVMPSSSLVPSYDDSTLLFTNAGMNQFKDFFLGQKKITYPRITTVQRCLRTGGKHNDLENVGYTNRHHTFFEMLGNFSFGDYFKKEAIIYAWELLTSKKWFNIPKNKLWISVYKNDYESYEIWNKVINIPSNQIIVIGNKNNLEYNSDNFWQMGDSGPCGPCTEIFYDYGNEIIKNSSEFIENKNQRFIEIWNIVFIEFNRISKTKIIPLKNKSIDTGMGLERISSVLQNTYSNYNNDVFKILIQSVSKFSNIRDFNHISLKIIADHIRACTYIIAEDITPSNEHRGYILRRIIRRALRHGYQIGIKKNFFYKLVNNVIQVMGSSSNIIEAKKEKIENILKKEEVQFSKTLEQGLKILNKEIKHACNGTLSGRTAFYLYDTFGFPIDLTADICREKQIKIDYSEYKLAREKQKKQSNINNKFHKDYNNDILIEDECIFQGYEKNKIKATVKCIVIQNKFVPEIKKGENGIIFLDTTTFYPESGGQLGDIGRLHKKKSCFIVKNTKKYGKSIGHIGSITSGKIQINDAVYSKIDQINRDQISFNHSATHLLHAALREILGQDVSQKGSLVTNSYLRFDFSYSQPIKLSQIKKIEKIINLKIQKNIFIKTKELKIEEAKKYNAIALFNNQYQSIVRVVFIDNFSIEFCGGTHAKRTGNIGLFKIIYYSSIASGIKRIEAVTGELAIKHVHIIDSNIQDISCILNSNSSDVKEKIKKLIKKVKNLECRIDKFQKQENSYHIKKLIKKNDYIQGIKFVVHTFYNYDYQSLKNIVDALKKELKTTIIIFININENNFNIITGITKNLIHSITALNIIKYFIRECNGKGGGRKEIAEGVGLDKKKIPIILNAIKLWISKKLENKKE